MSCQSLSPFLLQVHIQALYGGLETATLAQTPFLILLDAPPTSTLRLYDIDTSNVSYELDRMWRSSFSSSNPFHHVHGTILELEENVQSNCIISEAVFIDHHP